MQRIPKDKQKAGFAFSFTWNGIKLYEILLTFGDSYLSTAKPCLLLETFAASSDLATHSPSAKYDAA